jgi:uncharacterized protein (DUF924 family)
MIIMNKVLQFWFPNNEYQKWWFKSDNNLDQTIYNTFYNDMINSFNTSDYNHYTPVDIITDVILLDQMSRNISRIVPVNIIDYNIKAVNLAHMWINNKFYLNEPIEHTVFILLALRHYNINNTNMILNILDIIETNNINIKDNTIFSKFKATTIKKYIFV